MMGISLLSIGFGGKLAGILAGDATISEKHSLLEIEINYIHAFLKYFIISILAFIVVLILNRYIKKLISGS